jgi:hypothetical protein
MGLWRKLLHLKHTKSPTDIVFLCGNKVFLKASPTKWHMFVIDAIKNPKTMFQFLIRMNSAAIIVMSNGKNPEGFVFWDFAVSFLLFRSDAAAL